MPLDLDKQQLLAYNAGIIVLPEVVDHECYTTFVYLLNLVRSEKPDLEIMLYCDGAGGQHGYASSLISLIRHDGNVAGYLTGRANSCHSLVWAGCPRRLVYPEASIGVHQSTYSTDGFTAIRGSYQSIASDLQDTDEHSAAIYAAASNKPIKWWKERLSRPVDHVSVINAPELVAIGMATYVPPRVVFPMVIENPIGVTVAEVLENIESRNEVDNG